MGGLWDKSQIRALMGRLALLSVEDSERSTVSMLAGDAVDIVTTAHSTEEQGTGLNDVSVTVASMGGATIAYQASTTGGATTAATTSTMGVPDCVVATPVAFWVVVSLLILVSALLFFALIPSSRRCVLSK